MHGTNLQATLDATIRSVMDDIRWFDYSKNKIFVLNLAHNMNTAIRDIHCWAKLLKD